MSQVINIRLDDETVARVDKIAALNRRPRANLLAFWVHQGLEAEEQRMAELGKDADA